MSLGPYMVVIAPSARRVLLNALPPKVISACLAFINGPLRLNPYRVGKPLEGELAGFHAARRASFRIRYLINDMSRRITIIDIASRGDAYHRNRA
ncbi:MAG: type II toxin-antitoxin system RelE family toxin [Mycobacteriales bacterium]